MGINLGIDKEIARTAAKQHGNITRTQLLGLGLSDFGINWRVKHGRLYRVHRGVYAVGKPPVTPHERAMAAVLAGGPGAVLSHGSALTLWGIWKRWDIPFDVTVNSDRRPKEIRVHRNHLERYDTTRHLGIPVTTLARTLLDQAPEMRLKSLNRAINNGRLSGYLQVSHLTEIVRRTARHPGKRALEYCIGIAPERPSRSGLEDDFPAFCARYGLPEPDMDVTVCGYEVDALFSDEKVIVELDGWQFHSSRFAFEDDRERDATTTAAGFVTVRLTRKRLKRQPLREADRLHAILAHRHAILAHCRSI